MSCDRAARNDIIQGADEGIVPARRNGMVNRRRVILGLIYFGRNPKGNRLSRLRLTKYAFLLSRECDAIPKPAACEFVPYKHGPFSFALHQDLAKLQRDGYVASADDESPLTIPAETEDQVHAEIQLLPRNVRAAVRDTALAYAGVTTDELLRQVYSRFPWYAVRSVREDLLPSPAPAKPHTSIAVYTLGYEGSTVDGVFDCLLRNGIRRILDIRSNPVSRKYGFARSSMSSIAEKLGLEYVHMPELGIEKQRRESLSTREDYGRLLEWYERTLAERAEAVDQVIKYVKSAPTVLICVEADPAFCHRGRLAEAVSTRTGIRIRHLGRQ